MSKKVVPFNKQSKGAKIDLGSTVYDVNKQLVEQTDRPLTHPELAVKQSLLEKYFETKINEYAMLLCHEQRDYTIFHLHKERLCAPMTAAQEAIGCCTDRGEVYSIEETEDKVAYEIWIKKEDGLYCYYLFPYDQAVIEC